MVDSSGESRPPIPADLRRKILVEAGHRCAIPTCRYIDVEVHHIIPWSSCNKHEYDNLIALCPNCHRRADSGDIDRKSLYLYKKNLRFLHDKYSQFEIDFLFKLSMSSDRGEKIPHFMLIMIRRIVESGLVDVNEMRHFIVNGMNSSACDVFITKKGSDYIASISDHEF